VQVLLSAVLVNTGHAALEHAVTDISQMTSAPGHVGSRLPAIRQLLQQRQRLDGAHVVSERSVVAV
jgi:hypothetical protein